MLKIGSHRVGAKEIEDVLYQHPGVLEAAVVPAFHELLGEVPVAFVALRGGVHTQIDELTSFCGERLAPHKVPRQFLIEPELPKIQGVGKIDKKALRQLLENDRSTAVEASIATSVKARR